MDINTRKIIDYAQDEKGAEFRDALYASIHDKVTAHLENQKQQIAQNLMTPPEQIQQEEQPESDESVENT